ncbi:MAG TPA: alpha-amylase family glycosyl hydrolase [Acidobacteriaceae bacterium]|nr:alpha-amylase family glycosyl hydrolase [Acidobacteriaceae bacterium]
MMEFHIAREVRDRYQVSDTLFNFVGNVIFADLASCRELAYRMTEVRAASGLDPIHPGALFAMGLIDEISHAIVARYRQSRDPQVSQAALQWFAQRVGEGNIERLLRAFVEEFPNIAVYRGEVPLDRWLDRSTEGLQHREAVLEELMLLWLANQNPAFRPFRELYDDTKLAQSTAYKQVTAQLGSYFATRPATGMGRGNLLDLLRAPMEASPESLSGQLAWIRDNWAQYLGESFRKILLATDVLKEEELALWMRFHPADAHRWHAPLSDTHHSEVPDFRSMHPGDIEYERFSPDQDWMPSVVMIAKSTYVWLAQLSRQYGRPIERLDQVPDEELQTLANRGLTALWLIGLWERSRASQRIKHMRGQQDAVASAYSLFDYRIADDLGGEPAYRNLRDRAARCGIRLASDMVPNHMGIDSPWVVEHPEWFLSRPDRPWPSYNFNGPDLSSDGRVEIKIEDHYYDQSDAAVVFQRRDNRSGHTEYIYHGNDGTSFPWNDTAQLNYLRADVREQVIQTILHVARLFPIIRFDAAMTLARRHVQRLWFPLPGSGGSIPSRAESAMTQEEFDRAMPHEFWREVVDRVAAEVPGTLLLAEAFWLLEGYFVRTLGMHRVYNSAFMNMLRDEENAKYRSVIKNTVEFDPDILKRYVNFMSNPDERTAIDQFGTGDKYFGVCTMMATLPGLPMFGHGQIEAFTEKYGMEYKRPRYEETPNHHLVERHMREIAPLLKNRYVFTESANFALFDFWLDNGSVDENVFAWSNRVGYQSALVIYHNKYASTSGTLHASSFRTDKNTGALYNVQLHQALGLPPDGNAVLAYQDNATGLHYLCRLGELRQQGLRLDLHAYQYHVFQHWREMVPTTDYPWDALCSDLNGTGVWSLDDALAKFKLRPVHEALRAALHADTLRCFSDLIEGEAVDAAEHLPGAHQAPCSREETLAALEKNAERFFLAALAFLTIDTLQQTGAHPPSAESAVPHNGHGSPTAAESSPPQPETSQPAAVTPDSANLARSARSRYHTLLLAAEKLPALERAFSHGWPADARAVLPSYSPQTTAVNVLAPVVAWCFLRALFEALPNRQHPGEIFDRLYLRFAFAEALQPLGLDSDHAYRAAARIRILLSAPTRPLPSATQPLLFWDDPDTVWIAGLHTAQGLRYFNKETHEQLLWWSALPQLIAIAEKDPSAKLASTRITVRALEGQIEEASGAAAESGYRLDEMLHPPAIEIVPGDASSDSAHAALIDDRDN